LGVFTHEFGHFAGPLDHEQINGELATFANPNIEPAGFLPSDAFDVLAPFTEALFPFILDAPLGSQFMTQVNSSGICVATIDLDMQTSVANLSPTVDYLASHGSIQGRVLVSSAGIVIPVSGVNVICRRIDQVTYPRSTTTKAFANPPVVDGDGVPAVP